MGSLFLIEYESPFSIHSFTIGYFDDLFSRTFFFDFEKAEDLNCLFSNDNHLYLGKKNRQGALMAFKKRSKLLRQKDILMFF